MRRIVRGSAAVLATLLAVAGGLAVAGPAAAAPADLRINEVESNGDTQDWVELINPTAEDVDAAGLVLKDSNLGGGLVIAAPAIVPAGGYLAIDVDVDGVPGEFGLGAADEINLFATDGSTLIDRFAWGSHAATTYGACPPGSENFYVTASSTKGAENDCTADATAALVLNEIESDPNPDWVELKNVGTLPVDAAGLVVKDSDDQAFTIPSGSMVEPGEYLVLDALGYGLGGTDSVRVFADAAAVEPFEQYAWSGGHAATSFGRCADGVGEIGLTGSATKGAANDCPLPADVLAIKLNEVASEPDDIVELVNLGDTDVDVADWYLADSQSLDPITGPEPLIVPAGGYLRLDGDNVHFDFGLGNGDEVHLVYSDGVTELDSTTYDEHPATSWGRCPDGTGEFRLTAEATLGAANDCAADLANLVINEIAPDPDSGSDWVELMNTGPVPLDATGLVLKDSGESETVTIPATDPIPAGGWLAVDVTGLDASDTVRLFASDGTSLLTSHTYTGALDETWGRCPDGVGEFADTDGPTRGAANDCPAPAGYENVVINEVESSGGTPADWVEFFNNGDTPVDLSLWVVHDSEDDHTKLIPAGTVIGPHDFVTLDLDVAPGGFGLGNDDRVRLYLPDGTTLVDERIWGPAHATVTFGLCPDGTGDLQQTFTSTKGGPNDCSPVRINEVESSGGDPVDWVELFNAGAEPVDISGYVVKDSDDARTLAIPSGTVLAPGELFAFDVDIASELGGFGLGGSDSIRLFAPGGDTLLDSFSWAAHAATTYGRCPDGTGAFETTAEPTKDAPNDCAGIVEAEPWPGPADVSTVDAAGFFGEDMSGLAYESSGGADRGTLWAVNNGTGVLFKLVWDGDAWVAAAGDWANGKALTYPGGTGQPDAEGVGFGGQTSADGVYVATERDDAASSVSRPSVLRYDVSATGPTLTATHEWNLTGLIPAVGNNTGLEGIAWVPDSFLVAEGFVDENTAAPYAPADYPGHGAGLFFVGVEATGGVYAFALADDGAADLVATLDPGLAVAAEVTFESVTGQLWAACDDACAGRAAVLEIAQTGPFAGTFQVTHVYDNPVGMLDSIANEGLAFGDQALCVDDLKPVWYADDSGTDGHALREASIACVSDSVPPTDPVPPTEEQLTPEAKNLVSGPATARAGETITIVVGDELAGSELSAWIFSEPVLMGTQTVTGAGTMSAVIPMDTVPGAHRVAVTDAAGEILGWFELTVLAAGLPVTGAGADLALPLGIALALVGLALVLGVRWARTGAPELVWK